MTVLFLLLLIAFMSFGFLTWYFHSRARQEERKMLIQQGASIEEVFKNRNKPNQYWLLKIGIVVIGLGAAFIFISILNSFRPITQDAAFPGIFCLFGGISLVIAHYVGKKEKMPEQPEEIHLRKVLDGDEASFSYFVTRYKDMAFTVAISIVKDEHIAREVVQDAFVKAFRSLKAFKRQALFSTWFYRIVMNEALMNLKKNKREIVIFKEDYDHDIRDEDEFFSLEETEQGRLVNEALRRMAPNESLVLRLFYLQEENIRTVCEITGMSVSNVKTTLHRARKNMFRVVSELKNRTQKN